MAEHPRTQSPAPPSSWASPPSPAPVSQAEPLAWVALVLAACSFFVVPFVLAVVALVVAGMAERRMVDSQSGGEGVARAAKVVAWSNIVLVLVAAAIVLIVVSAQ